MSARRRVAFALLALALMLAQALALLHRAAHVPGLELRAGPAAEPGHGPHQHADAHEEGWAAALFAHDSGDLDCRLLDALGQEGPAASMTLGLVLAPPLALLAFLQGGFLARWAALFDARGPPATR